MLDLTIVIAILASFSAFLFVVSFVPSKNALSRTIEVLEARRPEMSEDATARLESALERVLPTQTANRLQRALIEAGWYATTPAQMLLRVAGATVLGIALVLLIAHYAHFSGIVWNLILALVCLSVAYSPLYWLNLAATRRKEQVQRTLPDFLDMVASTVGAGLAMNSALAYAVDAAPGALGGEIKEALSEIRLGRARTEALKAAASRLRQEELTTTIAAITQAERLGANVGQILGELAEDTRNHRMMEIETQAAKLPVKMVFPMAFFLLPALFVIIFGTLLANYFYHPHI